MNDATKQVILELLFHWKRFERRKAWMLKFGGIFYRTVLPAALPLFL